VFIENTFASIIMLNKKFCGLMPKNGVWNRLIT